VLFGSTTSAAASAAAAATSASNAATSASNASTSASNASTSATAAAASYDSFDDRYLGPKASAPSVDNDGNALLTGALYWNSTSNELYLWTGSAWTQAALTAANFVTLVGDQTVAGVKTLSSAPVLSSLTASRAVFTDGTKALTSNAITGTGDVVMSTSPTLVTPALGTPTALVGTNITGTASGLTAGNVTTNANLTGAVTSVGNATSLGSFTSSQLLTALTDETGTGSAVFATSPTLVTPILGTPQSVTLTNGTGLPIATGVSGLGTGVATALAVNVGSAGAPVVNGGALGTPSSGTVTNLTGTASININGTVGATTPAVATVTTLTATADSVFTSTGAVTVSKGTTAERPGTPVSGMFRFNTTTAEFEGYNGTAFASVGGAAITNDTATASNLFPLFASATSGTASSLFTSNAKFLYKPSTGELQASALVASNGLVVNSNTVAASYSIPNGSSAMSAGPMSVSGGVTVTVPTGSRWVVV